MIGNFQNNHALRNLGHAQHVQVFFHGQNERFFHENESLPVA